MTRVTRAAEHLSLEEVKQRMKSDPRPLYRQRWLIIYNALVDVEQEQHFLAPFLTRAQTGELVTVAELHRAFETHVGHEVDDSMIYRLLHRHGWRKLVPRPRHPKAQEEAQESFKKTVRAKQPTEWRPTNAPQERQARIGDGDENESG
jgi:hypothetical protein